MTLDRLTRLLQASISPVALISGVGLLILSFSNRFGRVMDRLRELLREVGGGGAAAGEVASQIDILRRRAHILRGSISCAVACVLLVSVLVFFLFGIAVLNLNAHMFVVVLFVLSLVALIASLGLFLWDMHLSLAALGEELRRRRKPPGVPPH
jgi:hypothetical protein